MCPFLSSLSKRNEGGTWPDPLSLVRGQGKRESEGIIVPPVRHPKQCSTSSAKSFLTSGEGLLIKRGRAPQPLLALLEQDHGDEVGNIGTYQKNTHQTRYLPVPDEGQEDQVNDNHHG